MPDPRQIIRDRAAARGLSHSALSVMAGRSVTYIGQYLGRGSPRTLPDDVRRRVAMALDLDETLLGARMPWVPATGSLGHG